MLYREIAEARKKTKEALDEIRNRAEKEYSRAYRQGMEQMRMEMKRDMKHMEEETKTSKEATASLKRMMVKKEKFYLTRIKRMATQKNPEIVSDEEKEKATKIDNNLTSKAADVKEKARVIVDPEIGKLWDQAWKLDKTLKWDEYFTNTGYCRSVEDLNRVRKQLISKNDAGAKNNSGMPAQSIEFPGANKPFEVWSGQIEKKGDLFFQMT
eukprot:12431544-Karenia_brevis.AAC.1